MQDIYEDPVTGNEVFQIESPDILSSYQLYSYFDKGYKLSTVIEVGNLWLYIFHTF
jgi:hypothetical protein